MAVFGGGKRDLDRVCTAVLDALQAGGAVRDDCLVDALVGIRWAAGRSTRPSTTVAVVAVPSGDAERGTHLHPKRKPMSPEAPSKKAESYGR